MTNLMGLDYTKESRSVNSAFANLSSRIGASGLGLQLCRLSPAACEGKEANKSGCLGSGFSLFISLFCDVKGQGYSLEVLMFQRFICGDTAFGVVHQQRREKVMTLR